MMFQLLAKLTKPVVIDDHEVKKKIIGKYGFVDKEEDERYHRPTLRKGVKVRQAYCDCE